MRTPIIVGNWKMNKTIAETEEFLKEIDPYIEGITSAQYGIATPYTDLYVAVKNSKNLVIGAENCHFEDNGAFTGEVSIPMLKEIGIASCIIGHSERRQMFGETESANTEIAEKCCAIVRDEIRKMYGDAADAVRVQYGGSVKPNNIKEYMAMEDIDGALIGGASLKVDSFKEIIDATK